MKQVELMSIVAVGACYFPFGACSGSTSHQIRSCGIHSLYFSMAKSQKTYIK